MTADSPLLEVRDLCVTYSVSHGMLGRNRDVRAVSGVSFDVKPGETLGLIGESGCGKSTVARSIVGLQPASSGEIRFQGERIAGAVAKQSRERRRDMQIVFQDPYSSLNPKMTVYQLITDVWRVHRGVVEKSSWFREVVQLLLRVGLGPEHADRYPRSFSGGQLQRISIARALAARPKLIVCDEAVSALDVSIQAQILNLLIDLQAEFGVAYVFISHDLGVVQHLCDRIAIMYLGKIVELGDRTQIYERPQHPYTEALLSAAPSLDDWRAKSDREIVLKGDVPSPTAPPPGCGFHPRCWNAGEGCATIEPVLGVGPSGGHVACHYPLTRTRAESSRDVGT